jgi:hypothetical protein
MSRTHALLVVALLASSNAAEAADPPAPAKSAKRRVKKKRPPKPPPPPAEPIEIQPPPPAEEIQLQEPEPAPPPAIEPAPVVEASTAAAQPAEVWEEVVDLDAEEAVAAKEQAQPHGGGGGFLGIGGDIGLKLFVDLLVDHEIGEEKFEFRPNHTYVFVAVRVAESLQFIIHVSDDPIFFELEWNITPRFSLKAGKLLVPFGTNEFHHIIGGRVDELSRFLPETWGDFGLGVNHLLYDGEDISVDYSLYLVNGFEGNDAPLFGAGDAADNNWFKDLGGRVKVNFFGKYQLTLSAYYGRWDRKNLYSTLFYAAGFEMRQGFIRLPILDRIRLRGEWARGEVQLPGENPQQGLLQHATARAGFYGEIQARLFDELAFRVRTGRINPDNTVQDAGDLVIVEPAFLIGSGKVTLTAAYQFTLSPDLDYSPSAPPDVVYAKVFLQF